MSTSFRSHFRHATQQDDSTSNIPRKPSVHIRSTKTNDGAEAKQNKAVQHVSKLARRASRSITMSDKSEDGRGSTTKVPASVTTAPKPSAASKRLSVTQASDMPKSGLPTPSTVRNKTLPLPPPSTTRTPSLVSGSTISTHGSLQPYGLRRKPSIISKYAAKGTNNLTKKNLEHTTIHTKGDMDNELYGNSVLGISIPPTYHNDLTHDTSSISSPPPVDAGRHNETRYVTPPVSNYTQASTPSTRFTESPFSHAPTPSSISSYSSSVVASSNTASRLKAQSPQTYSRPPLSGKTSEKHESPRVGLPLVREASNSSSNSTNKIPAVQKQSIPRKAVPIKTTGPKSYEAPTSSSRTKTAEKEKATTVFPKRTSSKRIPPELAHLNVDPPRKSSMNKPLPPIRPSRDGTSSIADMNVPSPVVQSDLPKLYTTYHKRTPSQETPQSASSPGFRSGFKSFSKQSSPRVDSAISPSPSAREFARGPTPEMSRKDSLRLNRKDSPALGTLPSPSKSPLRFFSRKPKTETVKAEKPKREPRKGPAAGTGHEGYGRFGFRGRSGSTTSNSAARSPSTDTNSSGNSKHSNKRKSTSSGGKTGLGLDDFLRERLAPVVLRGSGSTFSNTASSSDFQAPSIPASSTSSSLDSYPTPQLLPSAMRSSVEDSPAKRPLFGSRLRSDSSEDDAVSHFRSPTKPARRPSKNNPAPIDTNVLDRQISRDSSDGDFSAAPQTASALTDDPFGGREGLWLRSSKPDGVAKTATKPARKWNFFQHAHASPYSKGKARAVEPDEIPVFETHEPPFRRVAHYALLDMVEPVPLEDVERMVQDFETSTEGSMSETQAPPKMVPYELRHTSLLPSPHVTESSQVPEPKTRQLPPKINIAPVPSHDRPQSTIDDDADICFTPIDLQPQTPATYIPVEYQSDRRDTIISEYGNELVSTPERLSIHESPRQPRLSPVGRIPRVVSRRDQNRKLPDNSFSRPFARTQPHPNVKPQHAQIRELASPIESSSQPTSSTSAGSDANSAEPKSSTNTQTPSVSTNRTSIDIYASNHDFIAFKKRKDSDLSYTSSNASWMAALAAQPPQMDDPWHEYNDLLDDMMPLRTPLSAASSCGLPFQYSLTNSKPSSPQNSSHLTQFPTFLPQRQSSNGPSILSVPQLIPQLRQQISQSPLATPHTICDFVDQYGSRSSVSSSSANRASLGPHYRSGIPHPNRSSLPSTRGSLSSFRRSRVSAHSRSTSLPENNTLNSRPSLSSSIRFNRDTQLLDIARVDYDDQASASLRFGALMTSRWLSFGQVLFSPAHNEMRLADEPRVLIVDGLGSDWSYYVALNYPSASIYSLGTDAYSNSAEWSGANQAPPSNHQHIPHASLEDFFPFPKGFFAAVVFRFPPATTEQTYQTCISECKRVLRPGGHLEVAVLDLDLMNVGSRARKVVRDLKVRLQQHDENVDLRNMSDVLVRIIGRRGFDQVQRCIVGVPAAGRIPSSRDNSSISSGSQSRPVSWDREGQSSDPNKQELSFADLLKDARAGQFDANSKNDEGITKMVAKVGRWWYSTCYETPLLQTHRSIWEDRALLRECEKQGTSFRMLVCCAQKPHQTRRRTVSV